MIRRVGVGPTRGGQVAARQTGDVPQVVIVVALGAVAVAVAALLRRRGVDDPDRGPSWSAPVQIDRADFIRPEAPWLVVVFSSTTCLACESAWKKATLVNSREVAVVRADAVADRELHRRYGIDAVPLVVVADADGVVQRSFVGEPPEDDLKQALAELRSAS